MGPEVSVQSDKTASGLTPFYGGFGILTHHFCNWDWFNVEDEP